MKKVALLLIPLLLISFTSALTSLNIYLDESGGAIFVGKSTNVSNSSLPEGVVYEDGKVFGSTQQLTSKEGYIWNFSFSLEDSQINLILPKGATVEKSSSEEISTYSQQIIVSARDNISVNYRLSALSTTPNYPIIILIVVLIALALYLFIKNRLTNQSNLKKEIFNQLLSEREKIILKTLEKTGKIKMSYLRKMCAIPKASFSRHIQELEKKGLVKKFGEGKNKNIVLK